MWVQTVVNSPPSATTSQPAVRLALQQVTALLIRHRQLTWDMAKREVADRYTGLVFGAFWTIGHPLVLMLVYVAVFGFVFRVRIGGTADMPLDYTAYLLAGLIPWLT